MRLIRQRLWFALLLFAAIAPLARADAWTASATDLARKIADKTGPRSAISVSVKNNSSLTSADVAAVRSQIESQLQAHGMRLVEAQKAATKVAITLSENVQHYLWVASIQQGATDDVVMIAVRRPQTAEVRGTFAVTLLRRLLLVQDEPILDVALHADNATVLSPSRVAYYRAQGNDWQQLSSMPITRSRPFPRDVRGRIWAGTENGVEVSLPGVRCTQSGAQPTLTCTETDDPWPLSAPGAQARIAAFYATARNYFNGTVIFQGDLAKTQDGSYDLPPFYSVAVATGQTPLWMFAGVDGRVTFFSGQRGGETSNELGGWGSNLAAVASPCANESIVLASRNTDYAEPDSVGAYQIVNRDAMPLTAPLEFAGPITALWTSSVDDKSAVAVSRNLKTGKYEAYALSLACNR